MLMDYITYEGLRHFKNIIIVNPQIYMDYITYEGLRLIIFITI